MKTVAVLLLFAFSAQAAEPGPLAFSGRIQNEALAEEAIDLLHCVAGNLGLPWELNEEAKAAYALRLEETGGRLAGSFHTPRGKKEVHLAKGEANKVCEYLTEAEAGIQPDAELDLPTDSFEPQGAKPRWPWIVAGAALLAGGFLLWKSRPDHKSFTME